MFVTVFFAIKVWKLTKFRTRDGGSPTKDGSPIKKTTTTHVMKTKKFLMNCAFWLELTQNYHNFWTCEWSFCWNIQCLTIYICDRYFFSVWTRYKYQSSSISFRYKPWTGTRPYQTAPSGRSIYLGYELLAQTCLQLKTFKNLRSLVHKHKVHNIMHLSTVTNVPLGKLEKQLDKIEFL